MMAVEIFRGCGQVLSRLDGLSGNQQTAVSAFPLSTRSRRAHGLIRLLGLVIGFMSLARMALVIKRRLRVTPSSWLEQQIAA
jgi:hypothetical protein